MPKHQDFDANLLEDLLLAEGKELNKLDRARIAFLRKISETKRRDTGCQVKPSSNMHAELWQWN